MIALIPSLANTDPFHHQEFVRRIGAGCAAVLAPQAARNNTGG